MDLVLVHHEFAGERPKCDLMTPKLAEDKSRCVSRLKSCYVKAWFDAFKLLDMSALIVVLNAHIRETRYAVQCIYLQLCQLKIANVPCWQKIMLVV